MREIKRVDFWEKERTIRAFRQSSYGARLTDYADRYDPVAEHYFLEVQEKLKGIWRILPFDPGTGFEVHESLRKEKVPAHDRNIEVSRFCLARDVSKISLFSVFDYFWDYCIENDVTKILAWARPAVIPLYRYIGFQVTDEPFIPKRFKSTHYPLTLEWENFYQSEGYQALKRRNDRKRGVKVAASI